MFSTVLLMAGVLRTIQQVDGHFAAPVSASVAASNAATASSFEDGLAPSGSAQFDNCQVLVVGGATSGLAAALASAAENVSTCLLEPTGTPNAGCLAAPSSALR